MQAPRELDETRFEPTDRLRSSDINQVCAQGRAEQVASLRILREVLTGKTAGASLARKRAVAWAVRRAYIRPVRPVEPPKPSTSIADDLERAARELAAKVKP